MRRTGPPSSRPIRIASWPHWYGPASYLELFYSALRAHGVEHVPFVPLDTPPPAFAEQADALHLHWVYPYWRDGRKGHVRRLLRVGRLGQRLRGLRREGIRIFWTVHNLEHHEGDGPADRVARRLLHGTTDLRIFHSAWALGEARKRYGPGRGAALVMPHGNYDGAFPSPGPRPRTLKRMGIPGERQVLVCFGQLRPYKGFDTALAALDRLPPGTVHLVIAGRSVEGTGEGLRRRAEGRDDAVVHLGDLTNRELSDLLGAADAVLLPFRQVTGSGTLLAALTFGRAVVASDLPYFREILGPHPGAGLLVPPGDPAALAQGIEELLTRPALDRERAALDAAAAFPWPRVVAPVAAWLESTMGGGPPEQAGLTKQEAP